MGFSFPFAAEVVFDLGKAGDVVDKELKGILVLRFLLT